MMRFYWPISNLTFFWSAENEYNQFSSVIFAHSIIQLNWPNRARPKMHILEMHINLLLILDPIFRDEIWLSEPILRIYRLWLTSGFTPKSKDVILFVDFWSTWLYLILWLIFYENYCLQCLIKKYHWILGKLSVKIAYSYNDFSSVTNFPSNETTKRFGSSCRLRFLV